MKLNLSGTTLIQQLILQIVTGLIVAANTGIVKAQLTPDNTVGSTTRSDTVNGLTSDIIEGGATRGTNLFHSFTNFNVDAGKGVYFSNPADINNILTRVTGSSQSNIFGTLGVLGNANLFLINPNGISFGPNAQLDVKGSFVASTADKIVFDNYEFTTTNPTAPPLLTVNIPLGLGFRNNPGDINIDLKGSTLAFNNGQGLKVPQDKTLALIGGNVNINGNGVDTEEELRAGILSPGSQIQLGGLTQTGTVNFNENFYSTFPQGVTRGNVSLSNGAEINVRAAGGGSITINSRNLNVNEKSEVRAGIERNLGSVNAQAGDIKINNSGLFTLHNSSVSNNVLGSGNAGQINIKADEINISGGALIESTVPPLSRGYTGDIRIETSNLIVDGGVISTDTYKDNSNTSGRTGNIDIYSSNDVTVKNRGSISSDVFSNFGQNDGGFIFIKTNTLNLENGGVISTNTSGQGSAGGIEINATDSINISGYASGSSRIESEVKDGATGGGYIDINTSKLNLEDGGVISTSTYGEGSAGGIEINATDSINISGYASGSSRIESEVKDGATGNGGFININTSKLNLEDGGVISTNTYGQGSAGYIYINAIDSINISGYAKDENNEPIVDGSFPLTDDQGNVIYEENKLASSRIESEVKDGATGGGYIDINTSKLNLEDGGVISTNTYGQGSAGYIYINATDSINISGYALDYYYSRIESEVKEGATGNGGYIDINTSNLNLEDFGYISADTFGSGDGGNVLIDTLNLNLKDHSYISADTFGSGNGGNVLIDTLNLNLKGGLISTNADNADSFYSEGNGANAGNITITTPTLNLESGYISANTLGNGNAGNISITAIGGEGVNISNWGAISSSVFGTGTAGNITIDTSNLMLDGGQISNDATGTKTKNPGGEGKVGSITINASNDVTVKNRGKIFSEAYSSSFDNEVKGQDAGKITITTPTLNLEDGGYISADTSGTGNAGNIMIKADNINIAGYNIEYDWYNEYQDYNNYSRITSNTSGSGKGGNITITTSNLTLENGGKIITDTRANGDAGNIKLDITDNLKLTNSTISSGATSDSTGKAGNINIDPTLIELDSSEITVNSQGSGDGGNITLIGDNLNLNNSTISASTKSGQGGNITLNIPDTIRQNNSKIQASAGENGNGGNVTINTKFILGNSGNISTNAKQGAGGNIKITTQGIFGYKDNQISASSETGVDGVVETNTPEVDPSQGLIDLPENLLTAAIVTNSCRQGQNSQNSLIVKGRGGLALTSDQLSSSSEVEVDLIAPTSVKSSSAINSTSTNMEKTAFKTIIPAQGWEINSQGDVVLVAHSTGNPAERVNTAITCASN